MLPLLLCDWSWNCHVVCESVNIACLAFSLLGVHDNIYISLHWSTWISSPLPASSLVASCARISPCDLSSSSFLFFFMVAAVWRAKKMFWLWDFIYVIVVAVVFFFFLFFLNSGGLSRLTRASWLLSDHSATAIGDVTRLVPASRLVPSTTSKASTSSRSSSTARAFFPRGKHYHLPPHLAPYDRLKGEFPSAPTSRFVLLTCHHALAACAGGTLWGGSELQPELELCHAAPQQVGFQRTTLWQPRGLFARVSSTHTPLQRLAWYLTMWRRSVQRFLLHLIPPPRTHSIARLHSSLLFLCLHGWKPKTCTVNFTMFKRSEYSSWSNWLYVKWTLY